MTNNSLSFLQFWPLLAALTLGACAGTGPNADDAAPGAGQSGGGAGQDDSGGKGGASSGAGGRGGRELSEGGAGQQGGGGAAGQAGGGTPSGGQSGAGCKGNELLCEDFEKISVGALPSGGPWLPQHAGFRKRTFHCF